MTGSRSRPEARASSSRCSTPRPPMRSTPPDPDAPDTIGPLAGQRRVGDLPALTDLADAVLVGNDRPVEEHLVELDLAADVAQRPHLHARLVQVEQEVRDALALRRVGFGAREQDREVGEVRPGAPHLLARHVPRVAVALGARRERREVGAGAGLAEELAPLLLVAHHRRQEPQPLLLGAVRVQRGRGVVEAERIEAAEVERAQLGVDRPRDLARKVETAVLDRPRRHDEPGRRRTPGTTPRTRRAAGPRAPPPRRRAGRLRSTRGGTFASTHARTSPTATSTGVLAIDLHLPSKRGARFSRNAAMPSRKSSVRDDSSSANASFASWACELGVRARARATTS